MLSRKMHAYDGNDQNNATSNSLERRDLYQGLVMFYSTYRNKFHTNRSHSTQPFMRFRIVLRSSRILPIFSP